MSGLDIRPYRPGDEKAILDLFAICFQRPMSEAFWRWRFLDNPSGAQPMIELAWAGDTLAAHYAVSPVRLMVDGREVLSALSMTTMTHPAHRGKGLFTTLALRLYERMSREGYGAVWGFPNAQSHRGFVRDLGWEDLLEIPTLRLPGPARGGGEALAPLDADDTRLDDLWRETRSATGVEVVRDGAHLRWRLGRHPENSYVLRGVQDGRDLRAYVVYKRYGSELDVLELRSIDDNDARRRLVGGLLQEAALAGASAVNCWLPLRHPLHGDLEKAGFGLTSPVTYMGARSLGGCTGLDDPRAWSYAMMDSDVY